MTDDSPRILIAERDHLVRRFMVRVLTAAGYAVTETADGPATLDALAHPLSSFDAAILHDRLDGLSAPDVLRTVRTWGVETPALIMSGHASLEAEAAATTDARVALLAKPVAPRQLVQAVAALTGSRPSY